MATVNANNITLGAPEQATTGAVLSAPLGTTLPTTAVAALDAAFVSSGFVSEDGLEIEFNQTKTTIRDWSSKGRRVLVEDTEGTVTLALLEISEESLVQAFGADNVTTTPATASHGTQYKVSITGELPPAKCWVFNMKDGDKRTRLVLPRAQVTNIPNMTFTAGEAITLPLEISCYPDDTTGELAIFLNDDGVTA